MLPAPSFGLSLVRTPHPCLLLASNVSDLDVDAFDIGYTLIYILLTLGLEDDEGALP